MYDDSRSDVNAFIADGHADTLYEALRQKRDWTERSNQGHTDLARYVEAGISLQVLALFSSPEHRRWGYAAKTLEMLNSFLSGRERAAGRGTRVGMIERAEDLSAARAAPRRFHGLLAIEGGEALSGSIGVLEAFFRMGVRSVGLVWNFRNELADGIRDGASGGGLTPFGREVVACMERWGMAVDVSHLSEAGFWDVLSICTRPVFVSHANARALCDHPRNLTNDQLRAVAATGGVIGINFCEEFLVESGRAGVNDVCRHIEHVCEIAGSDHVALGSDFDGIPRAPEGLGDVTAISRLPAALVRRGVPAGDVRKVMGENLARLFETLLPGKDT